MEASLVYRNHILAFSSLEIANQNHGSYVLNCNSQDTKGGFIQAINLHYGSTPKNLKHCAINLLIYIGKGGDYRQGTIGGFPRPKVTSYHLMNQQNYSETFQYSCPILGYFEPKYAECCSIDYFNHGNKELHISRAAERHKVFSPDNGKTFYYVAGTGEHENVYVEVTMDMIHQMEIPDSKIVYAGAAGVSGPTPIDWYSMYWDYFFYINMMLPLP
jgi:hypothetical protein